MACGGKRWNPADSDFLSTEHHLPVGLEISGRNRPKVFNGDFHFDGGRFRYPNWTLLHRAIGTLEEVHVVDTFFPDVWSDSGSESIAGYAKLPTSKEGGYDQQSRSYFRPKELFIIVGAGFFVGGFVLLFKVLDKVYLGARFNVNMAVAGFFWGAILFFIGVWVPLSGFWL